MPVQNCPTDERLVTNVAHMILDLGVNEEVSVKGPRFHKSFATYAAQKLRAFFVMSEFVPPQARSTRECCRANFARKDPSFFRVVGLLVLLQHVQCVAFIRALVTGKISLVFAKQQVLLQATLLLKTLHAQLALERLFTNMYQSMLSPFSFSMEMFPTVRLPTFKSAL
jgi:hypothetical protein